MLKRASNTRSTRLIRVEEMQVLSSTSFTTCPTAGSEAPAASGASTSQCGAASAGSGARWAHRRRLTARLSTSAVVLLALTALSGPKWLHPGLEARLCNADWSWLTEHDTKTLIISSDHKFPERCGTSMLWLNSFFTLTSELPATCLFIYIADAGDGENQV